MLPREITNADQIERASTSRYRINLSITRLFRCYRRPQIVISRGRAGIEGQSKYLLGFVSINAAQCGAVVIAYT
jgi:hypothetical protein